MRPLPILMSSWLVLVSAASAAQEESVGVSSLFAEAPNHESSNSLTPPPLVAAPESDTPTVSEAPPPARPEAPPTPAPILVSPPTTAPRAAPSPAPAVVESRVSLSSDQDSLRGGRLFAQTDGALTAGTSQSLAVSLTARGGYLFTPQVAAGAKLVWSSSGSGSQVGGGAFATYHLSFGNPRIVPAVGGGVTIYSTSLNNTSHTGFLVDATGQIEAFLSDSVAVVPYATVAVGNLVGDPAFQVQLGWALAVYF